MLRLYSACLCKTGHKLLSYSKAFCVLPEKGGGALDNYQMKLIKDTADYIESNLLGDLNLDNISEKVNMSKYHLLRIWKGATSTGLMEYVRKRRIACSLGDLINRLNSVEFISSKYSFGCERTFNRVFKEEFGTTPSKWRRDPFPLKILDRFNADFLHCVGEGIAHICSIRVLPAFTIAGYEYKVGKKWGYPEADGCGADFFRNHRQKIINPAAKDIYIGYVSELEENGRRVLYQPSVKVDKSSIIPPDMSAKTISSHKYGVFKYMGLHSPDEISGLKLKELMRIVREKWMPTVDIRLKHEFSLEYIDYSLCSKQYCECSLYFPICEI